MIINQQIGPYPLAQAEYIDFLGTLGWAYLSGFSEPFDVGSTDDKIRFFFDTESKVTGGIQIGGV